MQEAGTVRNEFLKQIWICKTVSYSVGLLSPEVQRVSVVKGPVGDGEQKREQKGPGLDLESDQIVLQHKAEYVRHNLSGQIRVG